MSLLSETVATPSAPACLLCGKPTKLLYPSNVPAGTPLDRGELACTSPHLAVHDDIFVCRACGLARSAPAVAIDRIETLYRDVEDPDYFASEGERRAQFREALESLERRGLARPPGRLLEVGSSVGLFLDEARRRGWDVVGIEPSRWAAQSAVHQGLEVFNGTLDEFDSGGDRFDVVASWDVLEHLEDPRGALARAYDLVVPGGLLVFTTVNLGGLGRRIFRGRWPWFMRMHLHYFTRESLACMVRDAGFELVSARTEAKTLKLGYILERARSFLGPGSALARSAAERLGLAERPVRIDLGDILLVEARKPGGSAPTMRTP
jgi:2-polyprenyl-3-methyl-5-hydroxy-6-metoxy-1,4-benzoquinol methylase